jgi:hypothetical protein
MIPLWKTENLHAAAAAFLSFIRIPRSGDDRRTNLGIPTNEMVEITREVGLMVALISLLPSH